jgi:hypothetical protein
MKTLSQEVLDEILSAKLPGAPQSIEHVGTVRGKPYIKAGQQVQYYHRVSHVNSERLPSLSTLTRDIDSILETQQDLLHLARDKYQISGDIEGLNQIVTNDVIGPFQEPDVSSKRELRIFVCSKQLLPDSRKDQHIGLAELIAKQGMTPNALLIDPSISLKRLKGTSSHLKVSLDHQSTSSYSLLTECTLGHLLGSKAIANYIELESESNQVTSFYVVEETSQFSTASELSSAKAMG